MPLTPEEKDDLLELLRKMTPGHISTLVASLNEPDSRIGTSTDSANHAFLQRLCECGFAKEVSLEIDMPPEIQSLLTSFSIDEAAKAEIAQLL